MAELGVEFASADWYRRMNELIAALPEEPSMDEVQKASARELVGYLRALVEPPSVTDQVLDELTKLRDEDPDLARRILIATLDDGERETFKAHHAGSQMRDQAGRFQESRWRKAQPPKLEGARFFA